MIIPGPEEHHYGFKKLSTKNWLRSDFWFYKILDNNGKEIDVPGEYWVAHILKSQLIEEVPEGVKEQYEAARGAMIYGYFFYPLLALSTQQLYRVAEAAAFEKCKKQGAKGKILDSDFNTHLNWLYQKRLLDKEERFYWHLIRKLRNMASHSKDQTLITPGMAYEMLENVTGIINQMFK